MLRRCGQEQPTSTSKLQDLIEEFGDCKCSDLQDRVFGLVGHLDKPNGLGEIQTLPIDYSMLLEMQFFEVLKFCKALEPVC